MRMDCYLDSNKFDELCMNENEEDMSTNIYSFNDIILYTKYLFYAVFLLFNGTVPFSRTDWRVSWNERYVL